MDTLFPTFRRLANREVPLPAIWPRKVTRGQRHALLRLIALATEENLPLAPLVEKWAEDERGRQRTRLRRLADLLKSGRALPDALEEIGGILADEDLLAIRFDSQMGTRSAAVRQMLSRGEPQAGGSAREIRSDLVHLAIVLFISLNLITFLHLRIVPVFQKLLREFNEEQPTALTWSIWTANTVVSLWWVFAIACLVAGWCLVSTGTGRFVRHSIFDRWFRSLRELHAADVLRKLQIATAAGRPIPGALSTLARYHFAPDVRHKLLYVRNEVEQGADVWQSMSAVDLVTPAEKRLLRTADQVGNRSWILGQIAAVKQRRTRRRWAVAAELVLPALVLVLGAVVLFQALTIFAPLVRLIEGLL
jgi:type II secretory pathway component PulF